MQSTHIRLRSELELSRQESSRGTQLIVKVPSTGRYFRFQEIEGFVIDHLDGATSGEWICRMVEEKFHATLTQERLAEFTARLSRLGLVEDSAAPRTPVVHRRISGHPLYLRVKLADPDKLFSRMADSLGIIFTRGFVVFMALFILAAAAVTVANYREIGRDVFSLFHFRSFVFIWMVAMVIITMHEFAHGITCKRFGGRVHELGFMLIYLQPAFYCNVSDAWLFREKSRRLWVTFAGAWFEIFLWALATVAWRVTDPSTSVNQASLVVMATSGIRSLFNLNPLIKLDGYYLLSDWLEIPNLRRNAFQYLGSRLRSLLAMQGPPFKNITSREKMIYLTYSILAGIYSYWLFGWILTTLGGYLVGRYQGWGFALFLGILGTIFRRPIGSVLRAAGTSLGIAPDQPKRTKRIVWIAIAVAGLLLLAVPMELKVGGEFVILPSHNADLRSDVGGIIETIYHDEGDIVEAGAPVIKLSGREFQADLEKVKAQIDEKESKLNLLKAGTRQEELTLARTLVQKAEERLKYAQKDLDMDRALFEKEIISAKQLAQTEGVSAVREKELEEARNQLTILLAGSRKEEVAATQAEVNSLRSQEHYLNQQLRSLTITSPISGILTTHKLREKLGQNVNKGDLIAEIHQLKDVEAEIAVPEKEIADVKVGQKVLVKARAYPSESFEGTVTSIATTVTKRETIGDERMILVVTKLANPQLLLKPEMSGNAKIYCGSQSLLSILGRRMVRFFRVEFWSWW